MRSIITICLVLISSLQTLRGQQYAQKNMGFNAGLILAIGNKIDRIGVTFNTYYHSNNWQVNQELRCYFNLKSFGPKGRSLELVSSTGITYGYGEKEIDTNFIFTPVSNQTHRENSVAYAFNFYFNTNRTNQQTGTIALEFDNVSILAENDLFARPKLDRFRTGAFLIKYHRSDFAFALNSTLFTGQMGQKVNDESYPYSHRYKSDKDGIYSNTSNGLLSLQAEYVTGYFQRMQGNIGVDAEHVRHAIQNRFIHDMIFLPKNWRKQGSAHVPMLDDSGHQYLFKPNQSIKKVEPYINGYLNPGLFY